MWAVGCDNYPAVSLVMHWNGSTWRQVSVPNIGALGAVTVAPGRVWIAGGDQVARFNGTTWTKLPVPPVTGQSSLVITGLADTAAGLWAVGALEFSCGEGGVCTSSYAALWNGSTWAAAPPAAAPGCPGWWPPRDRRCWRPPGPGSCGSASPAPPRRSRPRVVPLQLNAIAADPAGNPWAVGWTAAQGKVTPAIINAPGIGQGGITVTTGASAATVTWTGPVTGAGGTDPSGRFAVGGLPDGSYTVIASLAGCQPGIATATVTAGHATAVKPTSPARHEAGPA